MKQIYCDLDGVLVDFEGGFLRNFGFAHDSVDEPEMWNWIMNHERHWHDLPMMHDGEVLWNYIAPHAPIILTGCPKSGYDHAEAGKHEWCNTMLQPNAKSVITCFSRNKPRYMNAKGDILIDDLERNIRRWKDAGGIGIHHRTAYDTIKELKALGF